MLHDERDVRITWFVRILSSGPIIWVPHEYIMRSQRLDAVYYARKVVVLDVQSAARH